MAADRTDYDHGDADRGVPAQAARRAANGVRPDALDRRDLVHLARDVAQDAREASQDARQLTLDARQDAQERRYVEQFAREVEQDAREQEQDARELAQDAREVRLVKLFAAWRAGQVGPTLARAMNSTYQRDLLARAAEALARSRQRQGASGASDLASGAPRQTDGGEQP